MPRVMTEHECPTCGSREKYTRGNGNLKGCAQCHNRSQKERNARKKSKRIHWTRDKRPRCAECTVLLKMAQTIGDGDLCDVCAGLTQKQMPAVFWYEPDKVVYV